MKYKIKELLAFVLTITLMISILPINVFSDEDETLLFRIDFEKERQYDFIRGQEQITTELIDKDRGKSCCFKPVGTAEIRKNIKTPITEGLIHVSLDYMATDLNNPMMYLRLFNSKLKTFSTNEAANMFETLVITKSIGYYKNSQGWTIGKENVSFEVNKWYDIDMWIDLDSRKTYFLVDGEEFAQTGIPNSMTDIAGLVIHAEKNTGTKFYIDNVEFRAMNEKDALIAAKSGANVPQEISTNVEFRFSSDELGNIYYNRNEQSFSVKVRNKTDIEKKLILSYEVSTGEVGAKNITLEPFEKKDLFIKTKTNKFGFFTVKAKLCDEDGTVYGEIKPLRFSVANAPKEGVHNPNLGITIHAVADHIRKHGDPVLNTELASKAGFGFVRNEVWWRYYEKEKGVFKFPWQYENAVNKARELGMEIIPIASYQNGAIVNENPPSSPEGLEYFASFTSQYLKDLGDVTKEVSVWNEYNHPGFNKAGNPPSSYADMLKAVYTKVKKDNPNTFVWGLVTAGIDSAFIKAVLDSDGGKYMDGVDVHHYANKSSPERGGITSDIKKLKTIMEDYNISDKPIYISENGWASVGLDGYANDIEQAAYDIRVLLLCNAYDLCDKYAYYTINDGGLQPTQEERFGLVKAPNSDIPYEAKPSYLSMCNYNALMIGAEYKEMIEFDNNSVAYKFKLANGKDCVVMNSIEYTTTKGLNLGADFAKLYDMYGNESDYYSKNGVFSFNLTGEPMYVVGNFAEFKEANPVITIDGNSKNIVKGDCAEINLIKSTDDEFKVETITSDNLTVEDNNGFVNNNLKIIFRSDFNGENNENISVNVYSEGKCIYKANVEFIYSEPLEYSLLGIPYNSKVLNRTQVRFEFKSNSYSNTQSGVLKITNPPELSSVTEPINIYSIRPGEKRVVDVNIPLSLSGQRINIEADVELADGETININQSLSFDCCVYAEKKPKIDGLIEKEEWVQLTKMDMINKGVAGARFVSLDKSKYGGNDDLSAKIYTMWDEANFYLALQVTDDTWEYDREGGVLWKSDGIQFGMAPKRGSSQVMVADMAFVGENKFVLEKSPVDANIGPVKNADYVIKRNGKYTIYEICVPWKSLFPDGFTAIANKPIAFSIMINENDGKGRKGYLEYGSGIGSGTINSGDFMDLYLFGK